jgi:hypothetical protein
VGLERPDVTDNAYLIALPITAYDAYNYMPVPLFNSQRREYLAPLVYQGNRREALTGCCPSHVIHPRKVIKSHMTQLTGHLAGKETQFSVSSKTPRCPAHPPILARCATKNSPPVIHRGCLFLSEHLVQLRHTEYQVILLLLQPEYTSTVCLPQPMFRL